MYRHSRLFSKFSGVKSYSKEWKLSQSWKRIQFSRDFTLQKFTLKVLESNI